MQIKCQAQHVFHCPPQAIFDLMVDPKRFPATFAGYGPIPAIRSIALEGPLTTGAQRRIHNSDGSVLTETVTALDSPVRHSYLLSGFRAPFSLLVTRGEADWSITGELAASRVTWTYTFTMTTPVVYPICSIVIGSFMRRAMQRCLLEMDRVLTITSDQTLAVK